MMIVRRYRQWSLSLSLGLILPLLLAACANKTALNFHNKTDCGTATITLTNSVTGDSKDYTVAAGEKVEIELTPDVEYSYEVTYPRLSDMTMCDSQKAVTMLPKGQTLNITLENVVDPALEQTQTAP